MPFICSICGEESARICARCTKDACNNHLCEKCFRCSDCCECEVVLNGQPPSARSVIPRHEPAAMPLEEEGDLPELEPDVAPDPELNEEVSISEETVLTEEPELDDEAVPREDAGLGEERERTPEPNPSGEPPSDQFS
jgi:hypothetical protein